MAATGKTLAAQSDFEALADALTIPAAEPTAPAGVPDFPWMETVLKQIVDLEAAEASERPTEGPPFPDLLDELTLPVVDPNAGTLPSVTSPFSGMSEKTQKVAGPDVTTRGGEPPGKNRRIWLATAAVLVLAVLGAMQWRSYRNHTSNGPLEVIDAKIRDLELRSQADTSKAPSGMSAAETKASSPAMRAGEQSKPQDERATTNVIASAAGPKPVPETSRTTVASQAQNPPPTASNSAMSQQVRSAGQAQPAGQGPIASYQLPTTSTSKTIVPQPAAPADPSAIEKNKSVPQAARDEDPGIVVRKAVPGDLEMTKAKNASDPDAQVAWLWKATAKGNPDAPLRLADLYIKGDVVPRSCEQAVVLLKTAAINDNVRACNRLASMYAIGICVTRNHVKAYRWMTAALAADPNNEWAQQNRDLTWQQMTAEERTLAEKYR